MGVKENSNQSNSPAFVPLEEGKRNFEALVIDGDSERKVRKISFSGQLEIGGVKKKGEDIVITLEIPKIKRLIVENPSYKISELQHDEFILASVVVANGVKKKGFLIPRGVVLSGEEVGTNIKVAWFLRDINEVRILNEIYQYGSTEVKKNVDDKTGEEKDESSGEKRSLWDKIKRAVKLEK